MNKLTLLVFILIIHTVLICAQSSGYRLVDKENGFTAVFPGIPKYEEGPNPVTGERLESYSFNYNGDYLYVSIGHMAYPPRTPSQVSNVLSETAKIYNSDGSILIKNIKISDIARQFDTIKDGRFGRMYMRTHLYIHRGRHFIISYTSFGRERYDTVEAKSFFSSVNFRIQAGASSGYINNISTKKSKKNRDRSINQSIKWYMFRGPDGDFEVTFPNKPTYMSNLDNNDTEDYKQYAASFGEVQVSVFYKNRDTYSAQVNDISYATREAANNYVNNAKKDGWRILNISELLNGAWQVELEGSIAGIPTRSRVNIYATRSRIYSVTGIINNLTGPNMNAIIPRFFGSFKLLQVE